jgi:hypothetical protein
MIDKIAIENTINTLNTEYNKHSGNEIFLSKLSLMEFCGWIEQSFDEILKNYINSKSLEPKNIDYANKIIDDVYSFEEAKIRKMLINILGIVNFGLVETALSSDWEQFKSTLNNFYKKRCTAAHTHIDRTTQSFDAPSVIRTNLNNLFPIMQKLETEVNRL